MAVETVPYQMIEDEAALAQFRKENEGISWLCFDTEFVGEKRFTTTLCLIQIATENGYYLVDTLQVKNIQPFLDLITDERILKVAHAGENDYRLLNTWFGIVPKNTFDTQIAAAFVGYKYPVSFRKLVESELNIRVSKGYTVTDWERRPMQKKQLRYALSDVLHLYDLWQSLKTKLERLGRYHWAIEESRELEKPEWYEQDPNKEALNSNIIKNLSYREQLFLLRFYAWRTEEARRKNYSKEMVLSSKLISQIVRAVSSGKEALVHNRRIPDQLIRRYGDTFVELFNRPITEEEKAVLAQIPKDKSDNPRQDIIMEMLHLLVRYKCLEENISHHIVMPRTFLKRMKADKDYFEDSMKNGWRRAFLGEEITNWLANRTQLELDFGKGRFEIKMRPKD
ncbi:MAG: ribonuclease D [Bacteroidetes bacterium]|nr:MAG: ribonuclease D [Bacteroidota bacterium]